MTIVEDCLNTFNKVNSISVFSVSEMASVRSKITGIKIKDKKYTIVLVKTDNRHPPRIKLCLRPDGKIDDSMLVSLFTDSDGVYHVQYPERLHKELIKNLGGVKLALAYYRLHKELLDDYVIKISSDIPVDPIEDLLEDKEMVNDKMLKDYSLSIVYDKS